MFRSPHRNGFSLVEVLVAMSIYSLGLGGLSLLLLAAIGGTMEARNHSTATIHAASLAELIAMTPGELEHYVNPQTGALEPGDSAGQNLRLWQMQLADALPGSNATVCLDGSPDDGHESDPDCDGSDLPVIKIFWQEPRRIHDDDGGLRRVSHMVNLP